MEHVDFIHMFWIIKMEVGQSNGCHKMTSAILKVFAGSWW